MGPSGLKTMRGVVVRAVQGGRDAGFMHGGMKRVENEKKVVKRGYGDLGSGACCVTVLIEGKEIIISNFGDYKVVLCINGVAEALTRDHRAEREDERENRENKGGYEELHKGGWRVHGLLTVSQSIGDVHLKDWVPAEPDTKTVTLTPDMEYLVLASDEFEAKHEHYMAKRNKTTEKTKKKSHEDRRMASTSPKVLRVAKQFRKAVLYRPMIQNAKILKANLKGDEADQMVDH
ncbi:hypothetical protein H5410_022017 [Solanum commersonii]|uniref:PPM-type phosphatase domain-containing protein n=1 Tax=Solanum commersonii TaxID=4109 RepID=A0A9J5ZFX8_SOLCO|nr:hypothetical protein H5410_022017 [Solanum commersonii]